ncbi:MAG: hypothetical protein LBI82_09730 [Dysgonamonadaceae bacterium]|jgi:hypothetical protein|nr:hypothetical protein [Dysgonamonadaceae bacterium]
MNRYLKFSPFYFFCLYSLITIFFTFCFNYILYDDALYYKSFEETLRIDRIAKIIEQEKFFRKIGYGIIPLMLLLRAFFTSICLAIGVLISEQDFKFSQYFNIAIKADIIFLFELIIKINYFSIFGADSLQEINGRFLSVLQWTGVNNVEQWLFYPMSILNVFELTYWILLALFISNYTKKSFRSSLSFVAKTYGVGLLLWVTLVVYISLFLI